MYVVIFIIIVAAVAILIVIVAVIVVVDDVDVVVVVENLTTPFVLNYIFLSRIRIFYPRHSFSEQNWSQLIRQDDSQKIFTRTSSKQRRLFVPNWQKRIFVPRDFEIFQLFPHSVLKVAVVLSKASYLF